MSEMHGLGAFHCLLAAAGAGAANTKATESCVSPGLVIWMSSRLMVDSKHQQCSDLESVL